MGGEGKDGEAGREPLVVGSGEEPQEDAGVRGAASLSCWHLKLKFDVVTLKVQ